MATKNTQASDQASDLVGADPISTGDVLAAVVPTRTPDNTPLPGGGRFRWDEGTANWVDQDAAAPAAQ